MKLTNNELFMKLIKNKILKKMHRSDLMRLRRTRLENMNCLNGCDRKLKNTTWPLRVNASTRFWND